MKKLAIAAALLGSISAAAAATYPFPVGENVTGVAGGLIGRLMGNAGERANIVEVNLDGTPAQVLFGYAGYLVRHDGRRNRSSYKAHYELSDCSGQPWLEAYNTPVRAYPYEIKSEQWILAGYAADIVVIYPRLPYGPRQFASWMGEDGTCHNQAHADFVGAGALKRLQNGAPFAVK